MQTYWSCSTSVHTGTLHDCVASVHSANCKQASNCGCRCCTKMLAAANQPWPKVCEQCNTPHESSTAHHHQGHLYTSLLTGCRYALKCYAGLKLMKRDRGREGDGSTRVACMQTKGRNHAYRSIHNTALPAAGQQTIHDTTIIIIARAGCTPTLLLLYTPGHPSCEFGGKQLVLTKQQQPVTSKANSIGARVPQQLLQRTFDGGQGGQHT